MELTFVYLRKVHRKKVLRKGKIIGIEVELPKKGEEWVIHVVETEQSSVHNIQTRYREGRYNWKLKVGFPVSFSRRTARIFHPLSRMFTLSWLRNARNDIFSNGASCERKFRSPEISTEISKMEYSHRRDELPARFRRFAKFFPSPLPPFSFLFSFRKMKHDTRR